MVICPNTLITRATAGHLCRAFGIKLSANPAVVQIAANAGFDALFIDLEHSTLSIDDASQLCWSGLQGGITPFVRVPGECGSGLVQRVLDGGAMGIIFPHMSSPEQAKEAVSICKYPPMGRRSMTGQLPVFGYKTNAVQNVIRDSNDSASSVIVMIESKKGVDCADEIAAVDGVDTLLVGSNDLAIELGVPGDFESIEFRSALETIGEACKKNNKIMGLAGIYRQPDFHNWAVHKLGVRFILGQLDVGLIASGATQCLAALPVTKLQ